MNEWVEDNPAMVAVLAAVFLGTTLVLLMLWLASVRNGRLLSRELDDADREVAEREREVAEQGTRLRMVRELHEVAVHSMSTIIRQSDGARYVSETDPGAAARSAGEIAGVARGTLADLRRIVTIAGSGESARPVKPSISSIAELLASMADSGLDISFDESGERFELQPGVDGAIYRIVEEALSNAARFGGPGTDVRVSFTWTREGVQVLVDDDGVRADARRRGIHPNDVTQDRSYTVQDDLNALTSIVEGRGVTEMRQRTAAFGGVFNAYPVPGVGFSVSAVFPALRYDNGVHSVNLQR